MKIVQMIYDIDHRALECFNKNKARKHKQELTLGVARKKFNIMIQNASSRRHRILTNKTKYFYGNYTFCVNENERMIYAVYYDANSKHKVMPSVANKVHRCYKESGLTKKGMSYNLNL